MVPASKNAVDFDRLSFLAGDAIFIAVAVAVAVAGAGAGVLAS
jgi:hypothetical protein